MSYLFESSIAPAQNSDATRGNANYLAGLCQAATDKLFRKYQRIYNIHDDKEVARVLIDSMGRQMCGNDATIPWAGTYVDGWRMVSMNAGTIRGMVHAEIYTAYQHGLDIRHVKVIGKMFDLAVQVWSSIGAYTGYSQDEGKR